MLFGKCCEHSTNGHTKRSAFDEEDAVEDAISLNEEFGGDKRHEVVAEFVS